MTSISSSIVLLAGAILLAVGSLVPHYQTQGFLQLAGGAIGMVGLIVWIRTLAQSSD